MRANASRRCGMIWHQGSGGVVMPTRIAITIRMRALEFWTIINGWMHFVLRRMERCAFRTMGRHKSA